MFKLFLLKKLRYVILMLPGSPVNGRKQKSFDVYLLLYLGVRDIYLSIYLFMQPHSWILNACIWQQLKSHSPNTSRRSTSLFHFFLFPGEGDPCAVSIVMSQKSVYFILQIIWNSCFLTAFSQSRILDVENISDQSGTSGNLGKTCSSFCPPTWNYCSGSFYLQFDTPQCKLVTNLGQKV